MSVENDGKFISANAHLADEGLNEWKKDISTIFHDDFHELLQKSL
jgi:hypothetical protein